jgi:uncharacterized membrane protein YfcA
MLSLQFLAILLGSIIIATRLPGIFYPKDFAKVIKKYLKDEQLLRVFSMIPFMFAIAIIAAKPMFTYDSTLVMSALGWLLLVAALYMMWEPEMLRKRAINMLKKPGLVQAACIVAVSIGIALIYLGITVY